ncbi:MAG: hypothetical protein HC892_13915 [Saprospiraceae bacterium]|nr:hypothetical protein [Saprospiraceae bacterium]
MKRSFIFLLFVVTASLFNGCIGTDLVDEFIGPDLSKVELSRKEVSVVLGQQIGLSATFYDYDGKETSESFTWTSMNSNIVEVSNDGKITGKTTGQAKVVVAVNYITGLLSDTTLVTVVSDPNAVASVVITGDSENLKIGETLQLTASVKNTVGNPLLQYPITWQSSNPVAATVSSAGLVTAVGNGNVEITAVANNIRSLPYRITVGSSDRVGTFSGRRGYTVMGTATITKENSLFKVNFANDFSASSGPGLHVYLSNSDTNASAGVDLGALKTRSGTQSYEVPSNINADDFRFVLIYCKPFSVTFGAAEMN